MEEYAAMINVRRKNNFLIDSTEDLYGGDLFTYRMCSRFNVCNWVYTACLFDIKNNVASSLISFTLSLFSDSVQLFGGTVRLQSMSHC